MKRSRDARAGWCKGIKKAAPFLAGHDGGSVSTELKVHAHTVLWAAAVAATTRPPILSAG